MKVSPKTESIFKKGSSVFYNSSRFFPEEIKEDVFHLYEFLRIADDFVDDQVRPKIKEFQELKKEVLVGLKGRAVNSPLVKRILLVAKKNSFKDSWLKSFLDSMESDLYFRKFKTYEKLKEYIYGSAEVIGLMMARILNLPEKAFQFASLQGRAFQLINLIRDVDEDLKMGRVYLPKDEINRFGLKSLEVRTQEERERFADLIRFQVERFLVIQKKASEGFQYLPKKILRSVKTAADLYKWTAKEIYRDPLVILRKKIKPGKRRIFFHYFKNSLLSCFAKI